MSFLLSHIQKLFLKNCFCRSSLTKKSTQEDNVVWDLLLLLPGSVQRKDRLIPMLALRWGWGGGKLWPTTKNGHSRGAELADAWPRSTALFSWCHRRGHPTTIRHTTLYLYYYTPVWMIIRPSVRRRPMIELLTAAGATELWNIKHFLNTKYVCISHKFHVMKNLFVKKTVYICYYLERQASIRQNTHPKHKIY